MQKIRNARSALWLVLMGSLIAAVATMVACGGTETVVETVVIEREVQVEVQVTVETVKEVVVQGETVVQTVVVERERIVEGQTVIETVVVEREVVVEVEKETLVEVEREVTATASTPGPHRSRGYLRHHWFRPWRDRVERRGKHEPVLAWWSW